MLQKKNIDLLFQDWFWGRPEAPAPGPRSLTPIPAEGVQQAQSRAVPRVQTQKQQHLQSHISL